jgi:site-specific DNA-methyltransferase (adenine-specific)
MLELGNIYHMDCMEGMKQFPDKYFELAIVDPEYGIDIANRNGSIGQKKGQGKITKYSRKIWDNKPADGLFFDELFRVSVNQIIWGANYFASHLPSSKSWIVWDKGQPEGVTFAMHELAFTSFKGQSKTFYKTFASNCNKVANNNRAAAVYAKIHPTQKPIDLYRWLLKNYAKPGDKILDTHGGSFSSVIACLEMGFEYIAFEIDEEYYKNGLKRIETYLSQPKIFTPEQIQPKQLNLL